MPEDDDFPIAKIATCSFVILLIIISPFVIWDEINSKNNCEDIGGEYQVVDEYFNGKMWLDVYGCVKQ
jgi:hypothetical protein